MSDSPLTCQPRNAASDRIPLSQTLQPFSVRRSGRVRISLPHISRVTRPTNVSRTRDLTLWPLQCSNTSTHRPQAAPISRSPHFTNCPVTSTKRMRDEHNVQAALRLLASNLRRRQSGRALNTHRADWPNWRIYYGMCVHVQKTYVNAVWLLA